jgi:DNA-binding response OmpR family regulator
MHPKAIVIVEDSAPIAELIKETLSEIPGYSAVTVDNGAEALAVIAQVQADLVILDYHLPGLTGIEIYDQLRDRVGEMMPAVLFVSAAIPQQELTERGIESYLHKPFDLEHLHQAVAALLAD